MNVTDILSTPEKEKLNDFFDTVATPRKNYQIRTKDGIPLISASVSASAKKLKTGLYRFKREPDDKKYIGFSTDIPKRLAKHLTTFRHPEKDVGKGALPKAVQKNAKRVHKGKENEQFLFGVLFTKEDLPQELQHLSLAKIEQLYIDYKKSQGASLFNKRRGGGGGHGKEGQAMQVTAAEVDAFVKKLHQNYTSPPKSYPINPVTLQVELTPSAKNGKIYAFKRTTEVETKRYIGKTERDSLVPRMAEHSSHARNKEKDMSKKPLYKDIRKHPKQFRVQAIDTSQFETDNLELIERGLIQYHQEKKQPLYNKNAGGGGGHTARK
ncbi:MAG: hypothetical protein JSR46_05630 [Verrucomicrobia bacterium]|nr:hypothetical protein [Verrucomicrobiota bacterium]